MSHSVSAASPLGATDSARIPHLLLVEDREESASTLTELLSSYGFRVTRVADGASAVDAARRTPVDVVILDVVMPGINGFEVCRRLKTDPSCRQPIVIMLTGLDDTISKLRGFSGGADDYIVKPVASKELLARVRNRLAARDAKVDDLRRQRYDAMGQIALTVAQQINQPLMAVRNAIAVLLVGEHLSPNARRELQRCQAHLANVGTVLGRLGEAPEATARRIRKTVFLPRQ